MIFLERSRKLSLRLVLVAVLSLMLGSHPACAYSLLTHEQLIDLTWSDSIVPLLLSRYPNLTAGQLDEARAYAYGGCVIQDIGYYPFGDKSFSDLTHYVRTGDLIVNLFRNASNADELAFAVGALSHYVGDNIGHPLATNLAVPIEFPSLREKYGAAVNYAEGEHQHVQTEFAFDINEISQHHVAPLRFMKHIGLQVPLKQLALAYYQTYGLREDFTGKRGRRINVGAYRFAVRSFIPRIAYAVTLLHRRHEPAEPDSAEATEIDREIAAASQENHWDQYRRKPGIGTYSLAGLLFILPKVGPFKLVAVKGPTVKTEADYIHSVALSIATFRRMLAHFTPPRAPITGPGDDRKTQPETSVEALASGPAKPQVLLTSDDPRHPLPDRDLDTGRVVQPGGYSLTDATYALLLHRLTRTPTLPIPPGVKRVVEAYYSNLELPITTKNHPQQWAEVLADLQVLHAMPTSTEQEPYPTYGSAE